MKKFTTITLTIISTIATLSMVSGLIDGVQNIPASATIHSEAMAPITECTSWKLDKETKEMIKTTYAC